MKKMFKIIAVCLMLALTCVYADAASKGGSFSGARMSSSSFKSSSKSSSFKAASPSKKSMSGSFGSKVSSTKKDPVITQKPTTTFSSSKGGSFSSSSKTRSNTAYTQKTQKAYTNTEAFKTRYSSQPPAIQNFYTSSPDYGMWNTLFLISMLNSSNGNLWFYHHQNDESVKKFKEDYGKNITDEELKKKLTNIETDIIKLQEQGVKIDDTYKTEEEKSIEEQTSKEVEKECVFTMKSILLMLLTIGGIIGLVLLFVYKRK